MIRRILHRLLISGNFQSLAGNSVYSFFSLITFLIMVRVLSKEIFGQWVLFMTFSAMTDMLKFGLTGAATIRLISTSPSDEKHKISASAYQLGLISTLLIASVVFIVFLILVLFFPQSQYTVVFLFYPLHSLINMPFQQAGIIMQGEMNFKRYMHLKGLNGLLILVFILTYMRFFDVTIHGLIEAFLISSLGLNIIVVAKGWDNLRYIGMGEKAIKKRIMEFGWYSTASYIGSNLLRSADTFLLSMIPSFGINAIAIYSIPMKFVEFVEMPLRSFTSAAFPKLSKTLGENKEKFRAMLNDYTILSTILLFPVVLILLLFPEFFLRLIGGEAYSDSISIQKSLLYVICIYIFILPLDRYSGVAFFAIDKPKINFYKILIMLISNIILDIVALLVFKSLLLVAVATVLFTFNGIIAGWYVLYRYYGIGLSFKVNARLINWPGKAGFSINRREDLTIN